MLRVAMLSFSGLSLAAVLFLVGCQGAGNKPSPGAIAGTPSTDAVACDKCKVVWTKTPITAGGGKEHAIAGYTTQKQMVCPECRSAVHNMFTTGKFQHTCTACGGNMEACAEH